MPETIYDALRESHEIQRSLCRKLLRAKPGTQDRISLFKQLHTELAAHAAAEERFLYAPVLMHDAGLGSLRHRLHEPPEVDQTAADPAQADTPGGQRPGSGRQPRTLSDPSSGVCPRDPSPRFPQSC